MRVAFNGQNIRPTSFYFYYLRPLDLLGSFSCSSCIFLFSSIRFSVTNDDELGSLSERAGAKHIKRGAEGCSSFSFSLFRHGFTHRLRLRLYFVLFSLSFSCLPFGRSSHVSSLCLLFPSLPFLFVSPS